MFGNMKDDNNPKSVESFTGKMASAIERAYSEKEKKEAVAGKVESAEPTEEGVKEENFPSTPHSYWSKKYCAINKDKCAGEYCFFWDKNIPCFNLGTLGNCTFLVASTSILALAGIVGDIIHDVKGE
jgi:hypothetical protein